MTPFFSHRFACSAALFGALFLSSAAVAETLNVSKLVSGTETPINWTAAYYAATVNPNATVTYFTMGEADVKKGNVVQDMVGPAPWGAGWQASITTPNLNVNVPAVPYSKFGINYAYSSTYHRQAIVNAANSPKTMSAMTFGTGSADAAISYGFKIDHVGPTQDYFMSLQHPTLQRAIETAYTITPGSNGGTYIYSKPTDANSRAAVDVYADGLPIWSSESSYHFPKGAATYAWDKMETAWGKNSAAGASTLYLGKLSSGNSVTITVVVRAASKVAMDNCPTDSSFGSYTIRCHKVTETVKLNDIPSTALAVGFFTKVL